MCVFSLATEVSVESNQKLLRRAYSIGWERSDDPHTKLGAVLVNENGIVIGVGANGFPTGVLQASDRLQRPKKYSFIEHAERNAIFHACRGGWNPTNATLYAPWFACADCARAIIQSGIVRVVGHKQMFDHAGDGAWTESIAYGNEMLQEAGVELCYYDGPIGDVECLFQSQVWEP